MNQYQTLITLEEADREVNGQAQAADTTLALQLLIGGSEEIETILGRKIVSRGTITEYHSFWRGQSTLWLDQWPVLGTPAIEIHEDDLHVYGADTLLVNGTDYVVDEESGSVKRLDSGYSQVWLWGRESIRVVYAGGYTQATVPADLKRVAAELFAMQWNEKYNRRVNISSVSDSLGSRAFFGPADVTSRMMDRLERHKRFSIPDGRTFVRSTVAA